KSAHSTIVVTVPGLGDDIQAIKAGLLEIADVLCVNKSDREGADRTVRDLMQMLDLRAEGDKKAVEIINTIATRGVAPRVIDPAGAAVSAAPDGSGITELAAAVERHRERAWTGPGAAARATARAAAQIAELVRALLADRAAAAMQGSGGIAGIAEDVAERR